MEINFETARKGLTAKYPDMKEAIGKASNRAIEISLMMESMTQEERDGLLNYIGEREAC